MRVLIAVKKIIKVLGIVVATLLVLLLGTIGFIETTPGKRVLANLIESQASRYLQGRLQIGAIHGNFYEHLTLRDVRLIDARGRVVGQLANLVSDHRIDFSQMTQPRLIIEKAQIEQLKLAAIQWARMLKPAQPSEKKQGESPAAKDERSVVWLQQVRLVEGRFESVYPINIDLQIPERLDRLPQGRLLARGHWKGLPVHVAGRISLINDADAARLSAVRKKSSLSEQHTAVLVARLGQSFAELDAAGSFNLSDPVNSEGRVTVSALRYKAKELRRFFSGAPRQDIQAKAYGSIHDKQADVGLEAHIEKSGKVLLEASTSDLPRPTNVKVARAEIHGQCPLLKLAKPATLTLKSNDPAPLGVFKLAGCGGEISYVHQGAPVALSIRSLEPSKFLTALSLSLSPGKKQDDLGKLTARMELPRGVKTPHAFVNALWERRGAQERISVKGELKERTLGAHIAAALGPERVDARAELAKVTKPGSWEITPESAEGQAEISMTRFDLQRLYDAKFVSSPIFGRLSARMLARGSLANSRIHFEANGEELATDALKTKINIRANGDYDARVANLILEALLAGSASRVDAAVKAQIPQSALRKNADVALKNAPLEWSIKTTKFDLTHLLSTIQYQGSDRPQLLLSLDAKGKGQGRDQRAELKANLDTNQSKVAEVSGTLDGERLSANLSASDADTDPLFAVFTNMVRTEKGKLNADFKVSGEVSRPIYQGFIKLRSEKLTFPVLGTSYDELVLDVEGDTRKIVLERLTAKSGKGNVTATGSVALSDDKKAQKLDLKAEFREFQALANEKMNAKTSGKLVLIANSSDSSFQGKLDITDGAITIPESKGKKRLESLGELEDVRLVSDERKEPEGLLSGLHGSIRVNVPTGFIVTSEDDSINLNLSAALDVGLDDDSEAFVNGQVKAVRGDAEVFGRRLEIRPSTVSFDGAPENPNLDLAAVYRVSPRNIIVEVRGDAENIKPRFRSDPPGYNEEQCLGVLLTGSPDYQNKGGGQSSPGSMIGSAVTGMVLSGVKKKLGSTLPIDTLTVDPGASDSGAASGPGQSTSASVSSGTANNDATRRKIEAGKYISDRIFVKLGRLFASGDDPAANKLTVDYRLSDRWSLETSQTDQGRSDLQVLWTLNY